MARETYSRAGTNSEGVVMRYRDRTEADAETLSVHWKRSLNKLRTLFDELALGLKGRD